MARFLDELDDAEATNTFSREDVATLRQRRKAASGDAADLARAAAGFVAEKCDKTRVVCVGESSHGTHEFYAARIEVTKKLILEKKCFAVLLEADEPPARLVHRYVNGEFENGAGAVLETAFEARFPAWMWNNSETLEFDEWLRAHNAAVEDDRDAVGIYGLDLYSLRTSMAAVLKYLEARDVGLAELVRMQYGCFGRLDASTYGSLAACGLVAGCASAAAEATPKMWTIYAEGPLETHRLPLVELDAHIIVSAEAYHIAAFAAQGSWNVRDRHFFQQLLRVEAHLKKTRGAKRARLARAAPPRPRTGTAPAAAAAWPREKEVTVGQLVREHYGTASMLVGQSTHSGSVACADDRVAERVVKDVRPGRANSFEDFLHCATEPGAEHFVLDLGDAETRRALRRPRLERAIGVVYRPETERASHYYLCDLKDQFDVLFYFDATNPVDALGPAEAPPK
ncbi:erythromycin esterase-domain-containing protein [Pelagophyceae sp. CCMP2097]|nr:erythromycin esterase-domain-containing protein [Pelagophyceae sp. CCMP2097]